MLARELEVTDSGQWKNSTNEAASHSQEDLISSADF